MLFPSPRSVTKHLANFAACMAVGLLFAYIGLNVASGCGQGGECIGARDFTSPPAPTRLVQRGTGHSL
jgi:hypothetical protein